MRVRSTGGPGQGATGEATLRSGGRVGSDLLAVDWAATPLGTPPTWPPALVAAVGTVLRSRFSMWMAWGPELTFLCNDAYRRDTLGAKYPWALGRPARQVWAEIWSDIGPRIDRVMTTGDATWDEGLLLFLERSGFREETYHTFSYSPLTDEAAQVAGMLCVVTEDTERVISARRMATLRDLGSDPTAVRTVDDTLTAAARHLGGNPWDLPFAALYTFDAGAGVARLRATAGIPAGHPRAPLSADRAGGDPWTTAFGGAAALCALDVPDLPTGAWNEPPRQALLLPLPLQGQQTPAGFLLVALNRYRPLGEAYRTFLDLIAGQVAAGLASALAYEAERERAEQLAELDRAKTAFFTNVSHELRTPLTLLLGPAEDALSDRQWPLPEAQRRRVEIVQRNALRLLRLVNTLLDFSRLEAGRLDAHLEPVDLPAYTAELAGGFAAAIERVGLSFQVDCRPLPGVAWVDPEMWSKVVYNLLSNALKFTFEGTVSVKLQPGDEDGTAELTVADTGIGIASEEHGRLFERFYRARADRARTHEGSGIGLALVAELVQLHGGRVSVDSEPGRGTSFRVVLPLGERVDSRPLVEVTGADAGVLASHLAEVDRWSGELPATGTAPVGEGVTPGPDAASDRRPRVLVVDDNADMRDYLARLLGDAYEVTVAGDGRAGIEAATALAPDLVLSDVMMPGMDGFELLGKLRAAPATAAIPVILLSARAGEGSTVEGLEAGADDYLVKPFSGRELLARVRSNLELDRVRRVRDRLVRSQALLDQAQHLAGVGSWELTPAGEVIASAELRRQLDLSDEQGAGGVEAVIISRVHPGDRPRLRAAFARVLDTGEPLDEEVRILSPDGLDRLHHLRGAAERDGDGRVERVWGSSQDVTQRRVAEQALAASAASREAAAREHRIADELQRSLLPRPSFFPEGLEVATFYRAGVEGTQVGGDWFDVVELGAGRSALVIGDVMGRGVRAAAVMGQLRAAVRAYARLDLPPHDVLELLDATVRELGEDQIVTCVYAVFDPADATLSYANAGHLPPLLAVPGGVARPLVTDVAPPLGTGPVTLRSEQLTLPPGALLAFYTDGLVERRGSDVGAGVDRLAAQLLPGSALTGLPDRLVEAMLPDGPDDDVAVLLVAVAGGPPDRSFAMEVGDDPANVERARHLVAVAIDGWGLGHLSDPAVLVASELVTNAIVHGRPPVGLRGRLANGFLILEVSDGAVVLPRPARPSPDDEHGRGLQIVAALADRWGTRTTPTGKVVWCRVSAGGA